MAGPGGLVVVTLIGLAAAGVLATLGRPRPRRYRLAEALMIAGTLPWLYLILRPGHQPHTVYLIPGHDLRDQFRVGLHFATEQIGGNLLVFAAFGFAAPVRWRIRPAAVVAVAALASTVLELTQFVMADGRVTSVDDVLVNAVGAGLFVLCSRRWWRGGSRPRQRGAGHELINIDDPGTTLSSGGGSVSPR